MMATGTSRTQDVADLRRGTLGETLRSIRWVSVLREVALLAAGGLLYSLVRGLTDDRVDLAYANADRVIALERDLGIFVEPDLQAAIIGRPWAVDMANAIYIAYWPIVIGAAVWLLFAHRPMFPLYRNALLLSGLFGLAIFAAVPLVPPRFTEGFVDTIAAESAAYRSFNASALVNEHAAMPSMHFGWVLLVGIAISTLATNRALRAAGVVLPVLMLWSIVVTGNHYVLDAVVGGLVVLAGLGVAWRMRTRVRGGSGSGDSWG
jgi:hypothetical protein